MSTDIVELRAGLVITDEESTTERGIAKNCDVQLFPSLDN